MPMGAIYSLGVLEKITWPPSRVVGLEGNIGKRLSMGSEYNQRRGCAWLGEPLFLTHS